MAGTVHVSWLPLSPNTSGTGWLDPTEQARMDQLLRVEDRRRFVTSRLLLKTLVGRLADAPPARVHLSYSCPHCDRPHGRPIVVAPPEAVRWHVSLSHSDRHVMVAVTDAGPVGVDLEQIAGTGFAGFDDVALTPLERSEVQRLDPQEQHRARAVYWARKESVLKATGHGLSVDPAALEVSAPHLPAGLTAWRADDPPSAPVQITDVPVDDDQVAAVAVLTPTPCTVALLPPSESG